jgi:integrase/recombinase XerD
LSDVAVMRLRSAAEHLVHQKKRRDQHALRDRAIFLVLVHTGLRVSELLALDRRQFRGRSLHDVKRKGKVRTPKVFVPPEARDALDAYLDGRGGDAVSPLFTSRSGGRLERQHVDRLLKQLAAQANSRFPADEQIKISPHVLRHTLLRKVTQKRGVEFAMEVAGHASSKYIWRYVRPSDEQKVRALENLF